MLVVTSVKDTRSQTFFLIVIYYNIYSFNPFLLLSSNCVIDTNKNEGSNIFTGCTKVVIFNMVFKTGLLPWQHLETDI
jgi:hypothetical protein